MFLFSSALGSHSGPQESLRWRRRARLSAGTVRACAVACSSRQPRVGAARTRRGCCTRGAGVFTCSLCIYTPRAAGGPAQTDRVRPGITGDLQANYLSSFYVTFWIDLRYRVHVVFQRVRWVGLCWSRVPGAPGLTAEGLSPQAKGVIRELLPSGLRESVSKVRSSVAYAVSAIAHWDWPEAWPQLFSLLMGMLVSGDLRAVHGAMRVLTGTRSLPTRCLEPRYERAHEQLAVRCRGPGPGPEWSGPRRGPRRCPVSRLHNPVTLSRGFGGLGAAPRPPAEG